MAHHGDRRLDTKAAARTRLIVVDKEVIKRVTRSDQPAGAAGAQSLGERCFTEHQRQALREVPHCGEGNLVKYQSSKLRLVVKQPTH